MERFKNVIFGENYCEFFSPIRPGDTLISYDKLVDLNPDLAARYAYIAESTGSGRASAAGRPDNLIWDEE